MPEFVDKTLGPVPRDTAGRARERQARVCPQTGFRQDSGSFLSDCEIARHKMPTCWRFVDEFPLTASGKVQKQRLREMFGDLPS